MSSAESSDEEGLLKLPHGALLDVKEGLVSFLIDRLTASFTIDDFFHLCAQLADIKTVVEQLVVTEQNECPTCGTTFEIKSIVSPDDTDYN